MAKYQIVKVTEPGGTWFKAFLVDEQGLIDEKGALVYVPLTTSDTPEGCEERLRIAVAQKPGELVKELELP